MVTSFAGYAWRASRPPLMRERCLRTVLISPMVAPERSSARVTACLSAKVTPAAGAIQLAEAPPDISTNTRSEAVTLSANSSARKAASRPAPVSYTHLRAHETRHDLVCRLLLEKKKK